MNLIICRTPLQTLIAEKIILSNPDKCHVFLYLAENDNEKHKYYYDKLSNLVKVSYYIVLSGDRLKKVINLIALFLFIRKKLSVRFDTIFIANINDIYTWFVLSRINFIKLNTFDDGTINIFYKGDYYSHYEMTIFRRIFFKLLNLKYYISKIKKISHKHYTIYPNYKNIIDNIVPIYLFDKDEINSSKSKNSMEKTCSIFIGQPIIDNGINYTQGLLNKVRQNFSIEYYFPHPRENIKSYEELDLKIIDTNLIIEDYLIKYLKENPNTKIVLYTFFSSAILNLSHIDNLELFSVKIKDTILEKYDDLYNMFICSKITLKTI